MKKTLVIIIHPDLESSVINKRWMAALAASPDQYTVHDLHRAYPDEKIDVQREQELLSTHDKVIFQFPFYWFNCPPFFKKWLDEVLTHGWAYGVGSGYQLAGKKIALAITAGIRKADYTATGRYKYTLAELTAPFEVTFNYIRADYKSFFAFYGMEHDPSVEKMEEGTREYLSFIAGI
ncbi:NAD(P)H-dependent oxidoreductase [Chitinophaga arvensicola]|uniref:Putative NADPH-quinone reductase (Modulator of drug activity B) n=1 Tax=Chitinophaga arvensicola TaxID=29529 RepID=A0A1I0S7Z3_9BACT|nr:NAD(P)H-dependent oxidoreductase [Chitinophaga arvensicola]SEW51817.1 Putative NADPH-quinone reductase (modulator of drug activity B) [Chitinophaga arvensicola]